MRNVNPSAYWSPATQVNAAAPAFVPGGGSSGSGDAAAAVPEFVPGQGLMGRAAQPAFFDDDGANFSIFLHKCPSPFLSLFHSFSLSFLLLW
jgi:hypothetical protein